LLTNLLKSPIVSIASFSKWRVVVKRLMGHLAQFGSFSNQGEVLCTQSLAYLLQNPEASSVFREYLSERVDRPIAADLRWKAEAYQEDGCRCDLEGCVGKTPRVKIEAKLLADFGQIQLPSYLGDLQKRCESGGSLFVLVPSRRADAIRKAVLNTFDVKGDDPWPVGSPPKCSISVIFWEDVLDRLSEVKSEPFSGDLAQFQAMYRVLKGYHIEPVTSDAALLAWRKDAADHEMLVDYVTRRLAQDEGVRLLPMEAEGQCPNEFNRRYVCLPLGSDRPCFSIGTRDPFKGHKTPIWMRFHRVTPRFSTIEHRLSTSTFSDRVVKSDGHVWIPLDVHQNVDGDHQVESLLRQAQDVIKVAYQPLP
jgi:hypothetical protein